MSHFKGEDSRTTFLGILIVFVFGVHLCSIENAELFLEGWAIEAHQPRKELSLNLKGQLIQGVAIEKATFLGGMPMDIEIIEQTLGGVIVLD